MKRIIMAVVAVFVTWAAMDYVIHGVILSSAHEQIAQLWRFMAEMTVVGLIVGAIIKDETAASND